MAKSSSLKSTIKDQSGAGKTKIGEILSKEGQITSLQLDEALKIQKRKIVQLQDQLEKLKRIDIHMEEKKRETIPQAEKLKEKGNGENSGS